MSAVSKPPVNCPSCGNHNDEDMQFCIFCGQPLAEDSQDDADPPEVMAPSGPVMVLVCTVCQRTDPLHGQFCVFCGSRTVTADASQVPQRPTYVPTLDRGTSSARLSGEYPYPTQSGPSSNAGVTFGMVLLLGLVGLLLGGGGVYLSKQDEGADVEKARPAMVGMKLWPTDGLVLYSDAKSGNVCIQDNEEKSFIFGMTGENGSLAVGHIAPGKYRVKVEGLKTKVANVNPGKAEVVGYPDRIKTETQRTEGF